MVEKEIVNRYYQLPRWLIFSVKMIDIISTRATLRILEYFFYKPVKFNVPQREEEFISKSVRSTMGMSQLEVDIEIYRMEAEGERVLLVHGWNGRAGQFHAIANHVMMPGWMSQLSTYLAMEDLMIDTLHFRSLLMRSRRYMLIMVLLTTSLVIPSGLLPF